MRVKNQSFILYYLYLGSTAYAFYVGLALVVIDLIVLGFDAYIEKDSRAFMGGLPRWEYIIHLLVNGFHFAPIAILILIKLRITTDGIILNDTFSTLPIYGFFTKMVWQLIPGGILLGIIHTALLFPKPISLCEQFRRNISCCRIDQGEV